MTTSVLDEVPGLGPTRRTRLLKEFGSVKKLREQEPETLKALRWLPDAVAVDLYARLHGEPLPSEQRGPSRRVDHAAARPAGRRIGRRRERTPPEFPPGLDVTVITGMSGAGRATSANVLEDLGFFVIDNLPPALIGKVAELARGGSSPQRYGFGVDVRTGSFVADLDEALAELRALGARTRVLFLEASDDALVRRFDASPPAAPARRRGAPPRGHPEGARAARGAEGPRRRRHRHVDAQRARAARPARRDLRRRRRRDHAAGRHRELRVQARAARSTSTSCSTAASSRTRTGSTSSARSTAATRRSATT